MHILTKVFVVLAAVLSLLLSALTVTYAVNAESVRQAFEDADRQREAADVALLAQTEMNARERDALRRELESSEQTVSNLRSDMSSLQRSSDQLRKDLNDARLEADQVRAQITQFGVATDTQSTLIANYREEVTRLRENELDFRDERLALEDRIADQASQILVLEQQRRALEERIAELREAAEGGTVGEGSGDGPVVTLDRFVRGRVDQVSSDPASGEPLVQIDLGSSDGLARNTVLYVVRDGNVYVADIVVQSVDLQTSTAEVTLTADGRSVRPGDEVRSRIRP
ncbi:MAG: hypothetical protein AAF297_01985 [Planctomycetota bacterium]